MKFIIETKIIYKIIEMEGIEIIASSKGGDLCFLLQEPHG